MNVKQILAAWNSFRAIGERSPLALWLIHLFITGLAVYLVYLTREALFTFTLCLFFIFDPSIDDIGWRIRSAKRGAQERFGQRFLM